MKRTPLKRKTPLRSRRKEPREEKPSKLPPAPKRSKRGPPRDPKYRAWIRTHGCIVPGCRRGPVQHCHVGRDGWHHLHCAHQKGHLPGMTPQETRDLFKCESERLYAEWKEAA